MIVTVAEAKAALHVVHSSDDEWIADCIRAAEREACNFINRPHLPLRNEECPSECGSDISSVDESSGTEVEFDARLAVLVLVDVNYNAQRYSPYEIQVRRDRAEVLLMPYRCGIGI